jgi:chromosome segregation ATPase
VVEEILQQLVEKVTKLSEGQAQLLEEVNHLSGKVDHLSAGQKQIKDQLDENTQLICALLHRTEELDAKYDGLLNNTATKDAIANIDSKLNVLNNRLFLTETEVNRLSLAK